jgi:Na+/melibiose symporter-like transporter
LTGRNTWRIGKRRLAIQLSALVLVAVVLTFAVGSFISGRAWVGFDWADDHCDSSGLACRVTTQFFFTWLALGVSFWAFLLWRYQRVRRKYVRFAKENTAELVQTAGSVGGPIVGRDDLCNVLQATSATPAAASPTFWSAVSAPARPPCLYA